MSIKTRFPGDFYIYSRKFRELGESDINVFHVMVKGHERGNNSYALRTSCVPGKTTSVISCNLVIKQIYNISLIINPLYK